MKHVIILGSQSDQHAMHLHACLSHAGAAATLFDASLYPRDVTMSWDPRHGRGMLNIVDESVDFRQICSVFWSSMEPSGSSDTHDTNAIAAQDSESMLRTFLLVRHIRWYNPLSVFQFHRAKPQQLWLAAKLGIEVPDSYIGNDPFLASQFLQAHEHVIFKPVFGGAETTMVSAQALEYDRLTRVLKLSPVTLQALVPGNDVRTFVIDDKVFSARIESDALDYRSDTSHRITAIHTPAHVRQQAMAIKAAFGMRWTAIDWRVTPQQTFVFLEANPSPMFMAFEQHTGLPVTECLVDALLSA